MIIYKITNKINQKAYIGQTIQPLDGRWKFHYSRASKCHALKAAIDKYGKDNFLIEEIYKAVHVEELNEKEQEFINQFNTLSPNGYNLTSGGDRPVFSEITRQKMSESRKAYKQPKEVIKKQALSRTGNKNHNFGKKFNEEHKRKLSESHKGNTSRPKIKVICEQNGQIYESLSAAANALEVGIDMISRIINGHTKSTKGYTFKRV